MTSLKDLSEPSGGDQPRRRKTGGRKKGTPNKRTKKAQLRADFELYERGGIKLARDRLSEVMNFFAGLMDFYAPVRDENGKLVITPEDMAEFRSAADMVVRAATALIPYQSPRLTAIAIAPPPSPAVEQSKHVTISVNIFDDKGELVDRSEQRNVPRDDLPLLIDHDADGVRQEG
jgi:hypothetical protein